MVAYLKEVESLFNIQQNKKRNYSIQDNNAFKIFIYSFNQEKRELNERA